jgi:hypothetical protein
MCYHHSKKILSHAITTYENQHIHFYYFCTCYIIKKMNMIFKWTKIEPKKKKKKNYLSYKCKRLKKSQYNSTIITHPQLSH